jgi:hypothetical protein
MAARPQSIYPAQGGILAASVSPDQVGPQNYAVKRDFRRELGSEFRREGYSSYWPNRSLPIGGQPTPSTRYIKQTPDFSDASADRYVLVEGESYKFIPSTGETLIHGGETYDSESIFVAASTVAVVVRTLDDDPNSSSSLYIVEQALDPDDFYLITRAVRPNGQVAVIAGTKTTLYRQMVYEDPRVYESGVYAESGSDTPVYSIYNGDWEVIGSGFSESGHRWQSVNINGYLVLNNGADLPVTYRVEDAEVVPIRELRENGVASVGWIAAFNDVLFCGNIRQLTEDGQNAVLLPLGFGVTEIRFVSNTGSGAKAKAVIAADQIGSITLLDGGAGYSEAPSVEIDFPDGADGATAVASIAGSPLNEIVVEQGGTGFDAAPTVTIDGGGGSGATGTATISGSKLLSIIVSNPGSGYTSPPKVTLSGGGGTNGAAVSYIDETGIVSRIEITNYGDNYTSAPTVSLDAGQESGGATATGTATLAADVVDFIDVATAGSGYINAPEVQITGDGTGATARSEINADGEVINIVVTNGGSGYTSATVTIVPDSGTGATAIASTNGGIVTSITLDSPGSGYLFPPSVSFAGTGSGASAKAKTRGGYVDYVTMTNGGSGFKAAYQTGSVVSGTVTANVPSGSTTVTSGSSDFNGGAGFEAGMVGKILKFDDGFYSTIASVTGTDEVEITESPDYDIESMTFSIVDESELSTDRIAYSTTPFFTAVMVGQEIIWADGNSRTILEFISTTSVRVDFDRPVPQGEFSVSNPDQYLRATDETLIDQIQYRSLWSNGDPVDFGAVLYGDIEAGSNRLRLTYPAMSILPGDEILIDSAGVNGGNLTATIVYIDGGGVDLYLDGTASTSIEGATVRKQSAIGGITGFQDLMDGDGSGIVAMIGLQDSLIIYKERSIYSCRYTGVVTEPFSFRREYLGPDTPAYPNAIMDFGSYHLYPSANSFFRYDLGSRLPVQEQTINASRGLFYNQANPSNSDLIFSVENQVCREWMLVFPSTSSDKMLAIDIDTLRMATSGMTITAASTITTQQDPVSQFTMALSGGMLATYLRRDIPSLSMEFASQTGYVLSGSGFTQEHVGYTLRFADGTTRTIKGVSNSQFAEALEAGDVEDQSAEVRFRGYHRNQGSYTSTIQSGMNGWGDNFNEKDLDDYVLLFGPDTFCDVSLSFHGARNVTEVPALLGATTLSGLPGQNEVPTGFAFNYGRDTVEVSGTGNPCEIVGRIYNIDGARTESTGRSI